MTTEYKLEKLREYCSTNRHCEKCGIAYSCICSVKNFNEFTTEEIDIAYDNIFLDKPIMKMLRIDYNC